MAQKDTNKSLVITNAVRVESIDFISSFLKLITRTAISILISACAIGTAYLLIMNSNDKNTIKLLLIITLLTTLWIVLMCAVITYKPKLEYAGVQMDKSGTLAFKYKDKITIKLNVVNEYKKKNAKLYFDRKTNTIVLIVKNLNGRYKIEIISSNEIKDEIQNLAFKHNIPIKEIE